MTPARYPEGTPAPVPALGLPVSLLARGLSAATLVLLLGSCLRLTLLAEAPAPVPEPPPASSRVSGAPASTPVVSSTSSTSTSLADAEGVGAPGAGSEPPTLPIPDLADRRLPTPDRLPPPPDERFHSSLAPVPDEVLARSTWTKDCPVSPTDLRYLTVSFWGFDGLHHTGEIVVHETAAQGIVRVFAELHAARFPIEEARVIRADELEAPPTGDGNVTTAFVCRRAVGSSAWSRHASGLAIDINPFHNPYLRGDLVLPELASAYLERERLRPGMIQEGDAVTRAFDGIGWGWGGRWRGAKDWMHFSVDGR